MKKIKLTVFILFCINVLFSQNTKPISIFHDSFVAYPLSKDMHYVTPLVINEDVIKKLYNDELDSLTIKLPSPDGYKILDLSRINIYTEDYTIYTSSEKKYKSNSIFYSAKLQGKDSSFACVSITDSTFNTYIMGDNEGWIYGLINNKLHGVWHELDVRDSTVFTCNILKRDIEHTNYNTNNSYTTDTIDRIKTITLYIESDYDIYQKFKKVEDVIKFIENIFAQTYMIYKQEGINIKINRFKIWDTPSGYSEDGTTALFQFSRKYNQETLPETFGQLLSIRGGMGIAWISNPCDLSIYRTSYCGLDLNTELFPNYSWNTMVMSHELGHNFGSHHTHACFWNGNNTAIDGCWFVEQIYDKKCPELEVTLDTKGTIMSYCHINTKVGINYKWGFGQQPGDLIRKQVKEAKCIEYESVPINCNKVDSSYTTLKIEISKKNYFEDFNYSIKQKDKILIEYNSKIKKLSIDTFICFKGDSCITLTIQHKAKSPYKNKIDFRIIQGKEILYEISNVYVINETVQICIKKPIKFSYSIPETFLEINKTENNKNWILYNLLGVEVSRGYGEFKNDHTTGVFTSGIYILRLDNKHTKKIYINYK
jgi:hypothetical protein